MQDNRGTVWVNGQEVKTKQCLHEQLGKFIDVQWDVQLGKMQICASKHHQFSYELTQGKERFCYVPFRHGANCPLLDQAVVKNGQRSMRPCAVVLLQDKENEQFLATQRPMNISFGGKWVLPGGHLELGQGIIQGGIRQCIEEVGLSKESIGTIKHANTMAWQSSFVADSTVKSSGIVIFIRIQCKKFEVTPQAGEIQSYQWRKLQKSGSPWGGGWAQGHLAYLSHLDDKQ